MSTQPTWKCIGHIGDVDPIAYGGGFVYVDETGVYGPELQWFEPSPDEDWHKTEGETPVQTYRVLLEGNRTLANGTVIQEWWYDKLADVTSFTGRSLTSLQNDAHSSDPKTLAWLYWDLIGYFGAHEFDQYPVEMTEDEAYAKYDAEMRVSLGR